jgi:outer membrane lipoprotein SlyB
MNSTLKLLLFILFTFLFVGCKTDISGNSYAVGSVGIVNRAVEGIVISKRTIDVKGSSETGAATGGVSGAIAGGAAGGDNALGVVAGALGGAVIGTIAGATIEESSTRQSGLEYVVKLNNGSLFTVVQGPEPLILKGDSIILLYGTKSRIIPAN